MTQNLRRRIERLEKGISRGDFETKVRALAERLGIPAERLLAVAREHQGRLSRAIGKNGTITWEGFCYLHQLGLF